MNIAINEQYYTVVFNDDYEIHMPASTYEVLKNMMSKGSYNHEINGEMINMKYYKRIIPRKVKSPIDSYILNLDKATRTTLMIIKKQRQKQYPYKLPFTSLAQVKQIVSSIDGNMGKSTNSVIQK